MSAFATRADIETRFPAELVVLAADEATGYVDTARVDAALDDASMEMRGILTARYPAAQLAILTADSHALLRMYCIDIALWRVALSFSRTTDALKERYQTAIKRLEGIAAGKGALDVTGSGGTGGSPGDGGSISPMQPVVVANERLFTRRRFAGRAS